MNDISLGISGFKFSDLYRPERLKDLHAAFWTFADAKTAGISAKFKAVTPATPRTEESEILIQVASALGDFLVKLFQIENEAAKLKSDTDALQPAFRLKKEFLNIRVFKRLGEPAGDDAAFKALNTGVETLLQTVKPGIDDEATFGELALGLLAAEKPAATGTLTPEQDAFLKKALASVPGGTNSEKLTSALKLLEDWCVQVYVDPKRRTRVSGWSSYVRPAKLDFEHLVHVDRDPKLPEAMTGPKTHLRLRDGFKLTDERMNQKEYLREIDYCIYCHPRQKDSCSRGFTEKTGGYQKNPLGISLTGCPLDERISEMHVLRKGGDAVGSLAMVMLDNPMCPGTGHRICNDCMKGCIFQKQDPVNIPQAETGVLTDVLNLPYGFEIYSLLTRFNPLNRERPYTLPYHGTDVLVVGLGPAGYTLVHYLANNGFGVVGIDGLKLEPVSDELTGRAKPFPKPLKDFNELKSSLDDRILMGFGGVSEYGITVRWDKTFLSVMYLTLLRRQNVRFYGGVRFGGTLKLEDAWELGFEHVALATGAGKPTIIDLKNNLIRGIRKASDFLMALQLTGAFKKSSMANLQVRLPAVVIGGGLTAIDTATELLAYYPVQVEKALEKFEALKKKFGEEIVWQMCDPEEKGILETFLEHGRTIKAEREKARKEKRKPDFISLCRQWGGVSLVYRKRMVDSPAYRLNHEEVIKALEEGITFVENLSPTEAIRDAYGSVDGLIFKGEGGKSVTLPAKAVLVAAGTSPNTIYEREYPGTFSLDAKKYFFKKYRATQNGKGIELTETKPGEAGGFFLSYNNAGRLVSFYGDNHPDYAGNVVKAMASAKHGAPEVIKLFTDRLATAETKPIAFAKFEKLTKVLDEALVPRVVKINRLTPTIVEVVVKGRYAARKFEPGQFYRLQNYETLAPVVDGVRLTLEGIALTGAWVDKEKDLLSMIVLEMGVSSRLCAALKPGEPVVVMGPTGTPSETPANETVLLAGGGLGNAVLFSIGRALRARGSKVVYFAGYRSKTDLFFQKELEESTDQVIWAVDKGDAIQGRRPQDLSFVGNIVQAMIAYAKGDLGQKPLFPLNTVDRILAIGSDRMMAAVTESRHTVLKPYLKEGHVAIASINSSMQCMMKEVCAQCLQRHVDPKTGKETIIFSCFNQDQEMDLVDFQNLRERLKMNSVAEKLSNKYLDVLVEKGQIARI